VDESSEGGLWSSIRTFFGSGKTDDPIRKVITEARDNQELGADVATMLLNVLNLEEHKVQDAMIPRTDIDCVEESAPIQKVIEVIIESGHSRIPIYRENKDHIIGIVHAKDLLKILKAQDHQEDWSIASIMRTPLFTWPSPSTNMAAPPV
jgi:magnesium and cobalt transporter